MTQEALKLALEALEYWDVHGKLHQPTEEAITAIKEALAQTQEPVAVYGYCPECGAKGVMRERRPNGNDKCANGHTYPSSTSTPPQRTEPLTDEEIDKLLGPFPKYASEWSMTDFRQFARAATGKWTDQTKHSYDYNIKNGSAMVRVVYAAPQPAQRTEQLKACVYCGQLVAKENT